jgi:hypothetical protein
LPICFSATSQYLRFHLRHHVTSSPDKVWLLTTAGFSSGILEASKHDVSETGCVSVLIWGGGKTPTLLGQSERANLKQVHWLRLAFPEGPNSVVVSPLTWGREQIQFPKRYVC